MYLCIEGDSYVAKLSFSFNMLKLVLHVFSTVDILLAMMVVLFVRFHMAVVSKQACWLWKF